MHSINRRSNIPQAGGIRNIVLEGEGVIQKCGEIKKEIISPNLQSCVGVTIYNPVTKTGAMVHFNHNVQPWIKKTLTTILRKVKTTNQSNENLKINLIGGSKHNIISPSISNAVINQLTGLGINQYSYDHYTWSDIQGFCCMHKTYCLSLNLENGEVSVSSNQKHSMNILHQAFYEINPRLINSIEKSKTTYQQPFYSDQVMKRTAENVELLDSDDPNLNPGKITLFDLRGKF
ncbi:MAG: hypothetical protein ACON35_02780 [Candidatus Marinamargulisbacteria bacterium]